MRRVPAPFLFRYGGKIDDEPVWRRYRCHLHSAPGFWAQYEGHVDVVSPCESEVFQRAVRELARTSFRDRPSLGSWRLTAIELLSGDHSHRSGFR